MPLYNPSVVVSQSMTQNFLLQQVAGTIASKAGTVTGTAGFGSSLFLQRLFLPAAMTITEIDMALSIGFPATNQGAGTMSRSLAIYSFGNSTSLASMASVSNSSAWGTGTSTAGGSVSLTQFQGGWSSPLIQPMTFASTALAAGEYIIAQLFDFNQASSTWTVNLYGANAISSVQAAAATNLTSATLGAMSPGGLNAASAFTASGSSALTAWTVLPTAANAILSGGLLAISAFTNSGSSALTAWTNTPSSAGVLSSAGGGTSVGLIAGSLFSASSSSALTAFTAPPTSAGVLSSAGGGTSVGLLAGSLFTGSTASSFTAFTGAPTPASVMLSNALLAGSVLTAINSGVVLSNSGTLQIVFFSNAGTLGINNVEISSNTLAGTAVSQFTSATSISTKSISVTARTVWTAVTPISRTMWNAAPTVMSVLSTDGMSAGSFFTAATGSSAVLANSGTAAAVAMASGGLLAGSFFTATSSGGVLSNGTTGGFALMASGGLLAGSFFTATSSGGVFSNANTASVALLGSAGLLAGSFFTSSASGAVLANAGTGAAAVLGSAGLSAGSFFTASNSFGAVTNVALGALNSSTLAQPALPNFGYIGTGSTTSNYPAAFIAGIMSTGGIPASIALTTSALTYSGSIAFMQPWFCLLGQ